MPSEVRVFGTELPAASGTAPALFSTFNPYPGDSSGVTSPRASSISPPAATAS